MSKISDKAGVKTGRKVWTNERTEAGKMKIKKKLSAVSEKSLKSEDMGQEK